MVGRLIILCGLPGSGKTILARELETTVGAVRLCSDEWMTRLGIELFDEEARARVEALQRDLAAQLVGAGMTVVYESGGWSRAERDEFRDRAAAAGARVELRFLDPPIDELWRRLEERNQALPWATAVITRENIEEWSELLERPDADELARYDAADPPGTANR